MLGLPRPIALAGLIVFAFSSEAASDDTSTSASAASTATSHSSRNLSDYAPTDNAALNALVADDKTIVEEAREATARAKTAQAAQQDAINRNIQLQHDILNSKQPDLKLIPLREAVDQGFQIQQQGQDPDALEDHGLSQLQLMGATDPDQAALISALSQNGTTLQQMHDNAVKMVLFGREIDALQKVVANQSALQNIVDDAMNFVPAMNLVARRGNVPGVNSSITDSPSTRENDEANALWNLPINQFERILPTTFENFGKQFGGAATNLTEALKVAKQYQNGGMNVSDSTAANLWDAGSALYGLLLLSALTWFLWRRLGDAARIYAAALSGDIQVAGIRVSRAIVLCAVTIALAMFVFPPANRVLGATEIFDGWHPLWAIGYVEEEAIVRSIAFPILLSQWGLLVLVAVAVGVLRRTAPMRQARK